MGNELKDIDLKQYEDLKSRMKLISEADPSQYHNEYSLKRYLRAFKTADNAFQAILKTNKWRRDIGLNELSMDLPAIKDNYDKGKARVLRFRDIAGRPIIYIPAKNHSTTDRNVDELTKFIIYCLEDACKRCFEEVIDNLCIIFDLKNFTINCMDYELIKNFIWLLSRHYPERLGVCLILNAPTIFSGCWMIIKAWLDENTSSKVVFINSIPELTKYVIPDMLPNDI